MTPVLVSPDALVIAAAALAAAMMIALAIAGHARAMRDAANAFTAAAEIAVTDETWRDLVEQLAADTLRQPVRVAAFSSLALGRTCCLRFALKDGRALEFRTAPALGRNGRLLDPRRDPHACAELRTLCRHFAQRCERAGHVPRDARWCVRVRGARLEHASDGQPRTRGFLRRAGWG